MSLIHQSQLTEARRQARQGAQIYVGFETLLFLAILITSILLRVGNLNYNSLFVDEAIYATVGEEYRDGVNLQAATAWMFGSPIYPIASSLANQSGGVEGMRLLNACLSIGASLCVYIVTRNSLGKFSALWAFFIFGLSPLSIFLGQYAVYDTPGIAFMALSLLFIVRARMDSSFEKGFLLLAAFSFTISVLAKYIGLLYLPGLCYFGWVMFKRQQRAAFRPIILWFVIPFCILFGIYAIAFRHDLFDLIRYSNRYSTEIVDRLVILRTIAQQIGLPILGALVGIGFLIRDSHRRTRDNRRRFMAESIAILALIVFALALPFYHLISSNNRGLDKHCVYALVLLAPIAGYGCVSLTWRLVMWVEWRPQNWRFRVSGLVMTTILATLFLNSTIDRNWSSQHAWPDFTPTVTYLRDKHINTNMRVLASGSAIYEYYLNTGVFDRSLWQSTWYFYYKGAEGVDRMRMAIRDHALDYVILDDYYTPFINQELDETLVDSGYRLQYQDKQTLGDGGIIRIRVFTPPN